MGQQHVDTPEVIYETLVDDTEFMSFVGQVTYKDGSTTLDAISIVTPGAPLPAVQSIQGLEVVIHDLTGLSRREYIGDEVDITKQWRVYLLAWDGANGSTIMSAATRAMHLFSKATLIEVSPTPEGIGAIVQSLLLIPSDSVVITD
jgi:hypothetical protein